MTIPPSTKSILSLYGATLRVAHSFSSYNFREYFVQRTRSNFREIQAEGDPVMLSSMYNEAVKELAVLKRSAIVNQLYGGWKLAVETQKPKRVRGDT
ncbi:hypothetical protein OF83DRAFT_1057234 [Amylostereum chailletii]|nr:hypothetical protein OF83DRAFT_1057234 [Amylostereum chailletii]